MEFCSALYQVPLHRAWKECISQQLPLLGTRTVGELTYRQERPRLKNLTAWAIYDSLLGGEGEEKKGSIVQLTCLPTSQPSYNP